MGKLKTGAITIGIIFLISIVGTIAWTAYDLTNPEYKESYKKEQKEKEQAEKIVRNYQGTDGQGDSIENSILVLLSIAYPNAVEEIQKGNLVVYWDVTKMSLDDEDSRYEVSFHFSSQKEELTYTWNVDMDSNEIIPVNRGAVDVINIVDTFN